MYHLQCSCLYLQLLYQHADDLSSETVPQIFRKKKPKKYTWKLMLWSNYASYPSLLFDTLSSLVLIKQFFLTRIGIRSEDLQDLLERSIKGSGISLSSPRLVIPAAIFGLWVLSHQYFTDNLFDFQVTLAYKKMFSWAAKLYYFTLVKQVGHLYCYLLFTPQIVPAMFGMFVYKAAVLVQVYRDNEDLMFVFPENEDDSSE